MKVRFYKYQGTGNDFVILNNMDDHIKSLSQEKVALICHRRFGVGADGLMLLEQAEGYDFKMVYYNSDGNQSTMCGNGGRCLVKFAHDIKVVSSHTNFLAVDGPHLAHIKDGIVHLEMKDVREIEQNDTFFYLNTGSPHYVEIKEEVKDLDVFHLGREIRYNERFKKEGTNVNFMQLMPDNKLYVRTYERGVEDETYSCGTGVTAAAITASFHQYESPVTVDVLGGTLQVSFDKKTDGSFENVFLIGPAERVFEGHIEI
jgi:diaminopimelate epimerase